MSKFALGEEKLARQIFPADIKLDVAPLGSNGFFATNFSAIYPESLSVFVPIDYVTNRISSAIPAEFESFFYSLNDFLDYFKRLTEIKPPSDLYGKDIEYAVGKFSDFEYKGARHSTFAILPNMPSGTVSLLCRRLIRGGKLITSGKNPRIMITGVLEEAMSEIRGTFYPSFLATADSKPDAKGDVYIYWNMLPSQLFNNPDLAIAGLLLSTPPSYRR